MLFGNVCQAERKFMHINMPITRARGSNKFKYQKLDKFVVNKEAR